MSPASEQNALPALYEVADLAARWRCNPETVKNYIRAGELRAIKIARRWMVDPADVAAFEKSKQNVPGPRSGTKPPLPPPL